MKIIFTGGGTGGHFYPIISVVEEMRLIIREKKLIDPDLYFLAPDPYDMGVLFDNNITYKKVMSGKWRRYFSPLNILDLFKVVIGIFQALWIVFWIYPDVIFSKGGFGSIPTVFAGKILGIPIIIHESDSAPGVANKWAGKFATKIAVSFPDVVSYFDEKKVAWTGTPIRKEIATPAKQGAHEFLHLDRDIPTIFVLGGSSGAQKINEAVIEILPDILKRYQIIHQVGKKNLKDAEQSVEVTLSTENSKDRYKMFGYLDDLAMRMSAGAASLIISRAGSTALAEIAQWGIPSIIIPITQSNLNHQRKNAFNYARVGAGSVIEENNLTSEILIAEIERIMSSPPLQEKMREGAKRFAKVDAGRIIAEEIINLSLKHEK